MPFTLVGRPGSVAADAPSSSWGEFTALTPERIVDTRVGLGVARPFPIGPDASIHVPVTGEGGIPSDGVQAVVLNVTAVDPTLATYVTAYPTGPTMPYISSLNTESGKTRANLVTVRVGLGGRVSFYNLAGSTHLLVDVAGYYADTDGTEGSRFRPVDPQRIGDSRDPFLPLGSTSFGPDEARTIATTGVAGVPAAGVTAVALNVTVTDTTAWSYLTASPADVARPPVSNVNYVAGETVANQVVVGVPPDGMIELHNAFGEAHVIVDIVGYYDDAGSEDAGRYHAIDPYRGADSRVGDPGKPLAPGDLLSVGLRGDYSAAVTNVTVTGAVGFGYIIGYQDGGPIPDTSVVNYRTGSTVANHAIVRGPGLNLRNVLGTTHLVVDVVGLFTAGTGPDLAWARAFGGSSGDETRDVAVDRAGNVYAVSNVDGDQSNPGFFADVAKLDHAGRPIWEARFGRSPGGATGYAVAVDDAFNVYVTGSFSGTADFDPGPGTLELTTGNALNIDVFVVKLDRDGALVWARSFGNESLDDWGWDAVPDAMGNVHVGGYFRGSVDFDPGPGTFEMTADEPVGGFVSTFDIAGNFVRAAGAGEIVAGLAVDGSGNLIATGTFAGTADFDPGPGTFELSESPFVTSTFVWKLDAAGNLVWARAVAASGHSRGLGVAVDAHDGVYTTGLFELTADFDPGPGTVTLHPAGGRDGFVVKLDGAGDLEWATQIGGDGADAGFDVDVDSLGNVYATGYFSGTVDFDPGPGSFPLTADTAVYTFTETFVTVLDGGGDFVWAGDMGGVMGYGVAAGEWRTVYTAGEFADPADFDPTAGTRELTPNGGADGFVSKVMTV